jgi:hypothetical protein
VWFERNGGNDSLVFDPEDGTFGFTDDAEWNTKADMDRDAPNSFAYKLHWTSPSSGQKASTLGPLGADNYPAAPRIRNLASLQSGAAGQPITIEWDPMSNGTANDWIMLEIWDNDTQVLRTSWPGQAGALNGTSTSYTHAGGLPSPSRSYEVYLSFVKVTVRDTTTQPGGTGVAGFAASTGAEVLTSVWNYDAAYGPIFNAGGGWYGSPTFGWLWFSGSVSSDHWAWSTELQGWLGRSGSSTTLWSPQYHWLQWSGSEGQVHTSTLGALWVGARQGAAITDGWAISDRFGYVWPVGDGVWFYSTDFGWLGVTANGGIWCVNQNRFL